jgi:membrane protein YdbS with pleckstrin-like domain
LSGNPNHRGAKEGMSRLGNKSVNNRFSPINSETSSKSEFYELLSNDKSLAAQRALALIDELEFTIKPPVSSLLGNILCGAVLAIGTVFFFSFSLFVFLTMVISIMGNPWNADKVAFSILVMIVPLLIAAGIYASTTLGFRSAKNTKYEFGKGLIKITKGAFAVSTETVEIYRIKGISVVQDWFSRRTGYATLVLTTDDSKQISLPGIAEARRAYHLQDRLRELTLSLRSLPWIKGIIT